MPQSTLLPTGGYSHILMEEDYGLNASRVVLRRLQQNYFGNEFGWITPSILVVIKQGYALLILRAQILDHEHLGQYMALLLPWRLPQLAKTKKHNWRPCCPTCTSLQLCVAVQWLQRQTLPLQTLSKSAPQLHLPSPLRFALCTLLYVYRCSSYKPSMAIILDTKNDCIQGN